MHSCVRRRARLPRGWVTQVRRPPRRVVTHVGGTPRWVGHPGGWVTQVGRSARWVGHPGGWVTQVGGSPTARARFLGL
eukprot:8002493-Pyramimonas_sp.AAC.1